MERSNIVAFHGKVAEAGGILEEANRREVTRVEQAIIDAEQTLAELQVKHSEVIEFVAKLKREVELLLSGMMLAWIDRERERLEDDRKRLAELRETPPPKLTLGGETIAGVLGGKGNGSRP